MQTSLIQKTLHEHLQCYPTQTFVIACSGGVDSIVLLHEMANLAQLGRIKNKLQVCYVDHGLSPHAVHWHNVVKEQCQQRDLPFVGKQVYLDKNASQSLEAQARKARYCALKEVASDNAVVITAHHLNDQIETFLLALKRGAGIKGLGAMSIHSTLMTAEGLLPIVRPMLAIRRHTLEERAQELELTWVEDESNFDQQFDRNFLRQTVIPMLSKRWTGIEQTIARTAEHCQDAQQLLDEIAHNDLQQCLTPDNYLSVEQLLALSNSRFNYVIRFYLARHEQLMPSCQVLQQLRQQLLAENDKTPQVKVGNKWFRRFQNKLMLTDNLADISNWQHIIDLTTIKEEPISLILPDNVGRLVLSLANNADVATSTSKIISLPNTVTELTLSFSHKNPVCLPDYRQHSRVLKKVLQELDIPPWQRKRIPLLFEQNNLVSAVGQFICQPYSAKQNAAQASTIKINVHWLANNNSS